MRVALGLLFCALGIAGVGTALAQPAQSSLIGPCLEERDDSRRLANCQLVVQSPAANPVDRIAAYFERSLIFDRRGDWKAAADDATKEFAVHWSEKYPLELFAQDRCINLAQRRHGRQIALSDRAIKDHAAPGIFVLQLAKLYAQLGEPASVRANCKLMAGEPAKICQMYVAATEGDAKTVIDIVDTAKSTSGWAGAEATLLRGMARHQMKDYAGALADFAEILGTTHEFKQPCSYFLGAPASVSGDGKQPNATLHALARYGRALAQTEQSALTEAQGELDQVLRQYPAFGEALMARAFVRAFNGDFAGALADRDAARPLLSKMPVPGLPVRDPRDIADLVDEPASYELLLLRADILDRAKKGEEAAHYRQRAQAIAPRSAPRDQASSASQAAGLDREASTCGGTGELEARITACTAVIDSTRAGAALRATMLGNRGDIKIERKEYYGAVADYTRAIELAPQIAAYYINRGVARERIGDVELAIEDYTKAIGLDPRIAQTYLNRGNIHNQQKRFELAIADYTKAIELTPEWGEAWANRGSSKQRKGDRQGALSDLSRAVELDPKDFFARVKRAEIYSALQQYDRAIDDNTAAIAIDPQRFEAFLNRGSAWEKSGNRERSLADYLKAVELAPGSALAHSNLGNLYSKLGNSQAAMNSFARAIQSDPKLPDVYASRGAHLALRGEADAALTDLTKAIELDPGRSITYSNRADVWNDKKQYDRAVADATIAIKLAPHEAAAYANRAYAYMKKEQWARAIEDYSTAFGLGHNKAVSYHNRGVGHERLGNQTRAIADYRQALRIEPGYESSKRALRGLGQRP